MRAAGLRGRLLLAAACLSGVAGGVAAQRPASAPPAVGTARGATEGERRVDGRVVRPEGDGLVPAVGAWVTLHRVGQDSAAPLDSMRTAGDGRYAFRYRPFGSEEAIYFVSASYAGIAYFSPPLRRAVVSGEDAEIAVFDTTSAPVPLTVRGRHLIVSAANDDGVRTVIEVFELSNDTTRTVVGGEGGERPTWSAALPAGAENFRVGQGDVAADAVTLDDGRALVFSPFAPGLKQFSFSYTLPSDRFPLALPLGKPATVLEVLVEEPTASVAGAGLTEVDPVSVDGRNFKRFLAQDAPGDAVVRVRVADAPAAGRTTVLIAVVGVVGAAMLAALARALTRRRMVAAPARATRRQPAAGASPDALAREIAALDAAFEGSSAPSEDERVAYQTRRAQLKARLTEALARGGSA
jgi:hypothetical protein